MTQILSQLRIPPMDQPKEEKIIVIAEFSDAPQSRRKTSATSRERGPIPANPNQSRRPAEVADIFAGAKIPR